MWTGFAPAKLVVSENIDASTGRCLYVSALQQRVPTDSKDSDKQLSAQAPIDIEKFKGVIR